VCLLCALPAAAAAPSDAGERAQAIGQPVAIDVEPKAVVLTGPRASQQILVSGRYADGSARDLTSVCEWAVENANVIEVLPHGYLRPRQDGTTTLTIRAADKVVRVPVSVKDVGRSEPIRFRQELLGVLGVSGCSDIRCHGAPSGKSGFRLSLWGHDPAFDYLQLTRDVSGRRTSRQNPDASLILLKALGRVPHFGGARFRPSSPEAQIMRGWLTEGLRDDPDVPALRSVRRLEVLPHGPCVLGPATPWQQLAVRAVLPDGSARDVTRLTVFSTSDEQIAEVSATGFVEFHQKGEAAILCRYLDQFVSVRLMHVKIPEGFRWPNPPEHNYVDRHVFNRLKMLGIAPSDLCSDQEFVRRVYLDVCGVLPTEKEVNSFLADRATDRRARLIDALLERPEYADFWTQKWIDVLRVSKRSIQLEGARVYHRWLREQVQKDVGFDQIVRALVTSQGHSYKQPASNYYCVLHAPAGEPHFLEEDMAETTAQLFLGVRLQCARCHNHPYERWTQADFAGFAALFSQVVQTRDGPKHQEEILPCEISLECNPPELLDPQTGKAVAPRCLGGPKLALDPAQDRREALADWLTTANNPFFAKALVNRFWYHLHGRGIVEPVDDFRDSNPSANDELLEALAREFSANRFRAKPVLRTILNSRTYQLSQSNAFNKRDHKYFSHVMEKTLPAEVLLDALAAVTGVPEKYPDFPVGTRAVQLPVSDIITPPGPYHHYEQHPFMLKFGQPARNLVCECARESEFNASQALEMMIGTTVTAKLRHRGNRLDQLLAAKKSDAEILNELYMITLARQPADETARGFLSYVAKASDRRKAWEDVLWTILRSQEFIYRH
jgi:hypothetical protein